jgi:hypothetical protein
MPATFEFAIKQADIRDFDADVVALKYAQEFYGADEVIAVALTNVGIRVTEPQIGNYFYTTTRGSITAKNVLFIGVESLYQFGYSQIRRFAQQTLEILTKEAPFTRHLAMTVHGPGYGLDEVEAALSQFNGFLASGRSGRLPSYLERISIVDIDPRRVERLRYAFEEKLAGVSFASRIGYQWLYQIEPTVSDSISAKSNENARAIYRAGTASDKKPHVFVAMPFGKELVDEYHYGIQGPVHASGFLCERIDQEIFTGDILEHIKKKIETATLVIAELSGANPNVYLEVGYAWGRERPTILLAKDTKELGFDVRGQRVLIYSNAKELEEVLARELEVLKLA